MTLEEGLHAHLAGDAGVSALVGTRIYPLVVPQNATLPAIVYQRISGPRDHAHDGPTGLVHVRIQLTFVSRSPKVTKAYNEARAIAEAARASLDGFSGTMGEVAVNACFLENDHDSWATSFEKPVVRHDYMIWYKE